MSEPAKDELNDETDSAERLNFEQALSGLEETVRRLEDGQIGLDDSLAAYERGVKLLRRCWFLLEQAERKVELLSGIDSLGRPTVQPFAGQSVVQPSVRRKKKGEAKAAPDREPLPPSLPESGMDEPERLF